jgi:hypothetical protein
MGLAARGGRESGQAVRVKRSHELRDRRRGSLRGKKERESSERGVGFIGSKGLP